MRISREYQAALIKNANTIGEVCSLHIGIGETGYKVHVGKGLLDNADSFFNLSRKVFIVTDSGVPSEYSARVAAACRDCKIFTFPEGEASKTLSTIENIIGEMISFGMQRGDAVIAVGGGVTGDVAGFAASAYMRGIDFYNIPTTLLSQLDSSVGGKVAVNFNGIKNAVGAFYQPKGVIVDTDVLSTLPRRHIAAGLAEAVKMAATSDAELFELIEDGLAERDIGELIKRALTIKKRIVEVDEREGGLRRILNFGHTLGHGIESLGGRLHGECVALGMLPFSAGEARSRITAVLNSCGLETEANYDTVRAFEHMKHDKKADGEGVFAVFVDKIGACRIEKLTLSQLEELILKSI